MKLLSVVLAIAAIVSISAIALREQVFSESTDASPQSAANDGADHVPVKTVEVVLEESYTVNRQYSGELVPLRTSDLGFEREGYLKSVLVREGSTVKQGDMIATLDTRRLAETLRELEAQQREAKAMLDELIAGPRSQELRAALEEVNGLTAQLSYVTATRKRNESLLERDAGTLDDVQLARARERQVAAELAAANERLDELNEGSRREKIQAQSARSDQLAAQKNLLKIELEDSNLRAPYAGRIAERFVHEGTVIEKGEPIVRLLEDGKLTARIGVPFDATDMLPSGKEVKVYCNGLPYQGVVVTKLPALNDTTRTATIVIDLNEDASKDLIVGGVVHLDLQQQVAKAGCWLPTSALVRGTRGLWACLTVTQTERVPRVKTAAGMETTDALDDAFRTIGLLQKHDVEILHTDEKRVFVRGTFADGDRVVADGIHRVVHGQYVELIGG